MHNRGKDTVANILVSQSEFERVAFADAIRSILWEMNPIVKDSGFTVQGVVTAYRLGSSQSYVF
jgi:hypothetical protein